MLAILVRFITQSGCVLCDAGWSERKRGVLSPRASVIPARKPINDIRGVTVTSGGVLQSETSQLSICYWGMNDEKSPNNDKRNAGYTR